MYVEILFISWPELTTQLQVLILRKKTVSQDLKKHSPDVGFPVEIDVTDVTDVDSIVVVLSSTSALVVLSSVVAAVVGCGVCFTSVVCIESVLFAIMCKAANLKKIN